ncbi:MAG: NAD(P)H-hydrate dehydratase [Acidimicrobiales bacterium]
MIPVLSPEEMRAVDAAAAEPIEVLIGRAGWAVADCARRLLGGTYGKRVAVFAGKGNNGADGRVGAALLTRWGVRCELLGPTDRLPTGRAFDLVIDACYGTGFHGEFVAPDVGTVPVLAVDIPSGVDGLTGEIRGRAMTAVATLCFAAPKPGNLLAGAVGGDLVVCDLGLELPHSSAALAQASDLLRWPSRPTDHHKWQSAIRVVGGHRRGPGAPTLAAHGAARAGASYVQFAVPGAPDLNGPIESVTVDAEAPIDKRLRCLVVGPGLPVSPQAATLVSSILADGGSQPIVLDAGGLSAIASRLDEVAASTHPIVMTPHDGEYRQLMGRDPGYDRTSAARALAAQAEAIVLLKGPVTIAASPAGEVVYSCAGDQRLATAGSGDVLSGVIGAAIAQGIPPFDAAWLATELVGRSLDQAPRAGVTASDLPSFVAGYLAAQAPKGGGR